MMSSNFIANGDRKLRKEIKESITKKYKFHLDTAGFFKRFKIKQFIRFEIKMEFPKLKKEISDQVLFLKK